MKHIDRSVIETTDHFTTAFTFQSLVVGNVEEWYENINITFVPDEIKINQIIYNTLIANSDIIFITTSLLPDRVPIISACGNLASSMPFVNFVNTRPINGRYRFANVINALCPPTLPLQNTQLSITFEFIRYGRK